ncbi:hypothetical protein [Actinocrispum wychmicini]|uniref:Uncharacterized protein n=1 Tax=Actinocrispum wychmicini TaxID=1213861 RepID=A0A4V2S7E2_9PSEU|nr:hypothetical protein [Actinocrispum wychmicini]TCO59590.1 hypothetical protein EV192_104433 [Actinocrispum wychmicini]
MPQNRWRKGIAVVVVMVAAVAGLTSGSASGAVDKAKPAATASADVDITGLYQFNGNGSTGTLRILTAAQGRVIANMHYFVRGADEFLGGTWEPGSRTLTLVRPLGSSSVSQTYTMWVGTNDMGTSVGNLMFGGFFTESDAGDNRFGAFANFQSR